MHKLCICQSGKQYSKCCEPFLTGQKHAKTPVQLMRSRYSAFALGSYGDYLLATWAPMYRSGLSSSDLSVKTTDWVGLEVINKSQSNNSATVEFKAKYIQEGETLEHHEKSLFERVDGQWFYLVGEFD